MARKDRAKLILTFDDGTTKEIVLNNAVEINVPGQEVGIRQDKKGQWFMYYKPETFEGKKLAEDNFLTISKIV